MDASSRHMIFAESATKQQSARGICLCLLWKGKAHCNSEMCTYAHQCFPALSSLTVSPSRGDGRVKVPFKFQQVLLLCNDWGPKEASTHGKAREARLWQTSWHTSCSYPYKYFYAFGKTFIQRKFPETSSFAFHCSLKKMVVTWKWSFSRRYWDL